MAWELLKTDYTDAVWTGYKKYTEISNDDGTVSFVDVTIYTDKENSFFGAKDANAMNEAMNYIMSMLESGTDLYEEFLEYFQTQKELFEQSADDVIANVKALSDEDYAAFVAYLEQLQEQYELNMATFESEQQVAFDNWFQNIKDMLSGDVAGNLQNEIDELGDRMDLVEYMTLQNDFSAPLVDESDGYLLADDLDYVLLADWQYDYK